MGRHRKAAIGRSEGPAVEQSIPGAARCRTAAASLRFSVMMNIRRARERGHGDHGWLDTWHTFSFADYYDPKHMGFRALRVINDDTIAAGTGFGTHPHRDMEIVTYVLEGAIGHKDSMGNGSVIQPGEVQRMSAGTGVRHSEHNANPKGKTHFLQIWIQPDKSGYPPGYEQTHFPDAEKRGRLRLVASSDGRDGSVTIHQDAAIHAGLFDGAETATYRIAPGRATWVHVARGALDVNGTRLSAGDGASFTGDESITFANGDAAEVLVFDLP
jgi:redox-sensitive bicupin YhaK (pirin superfamily)